MNTYVVVIYSKLYGTERVDGPFESHKAAQQYGENLDHKLREDERWAVHGLCTPDRRFVE